MPIAEKPKFAYLTRLLGVTLLEIMLVLAIAAMIIVMSVRYYQSATAGQQANATLEQIQAIIASADSLMQASGSYSGVTSATLASLLPPPGLKTAWGTDIKITPTAAKLTITFGNMPANICPLISTKLLANNRYNKITTCTSKAVDIAVVYNASGV